MQCGKNDEGILLGFQSTAAQSRALLSNKAKKSHFLTPPPVKISGGVREIYGLLVVAAPMTEPLVYICWLASPRV